MSGSSEEGGYTWEGAAIQVGNKENKQTKTAYAVYFGPVSFLHLQSASIHMFTPCIQLLFNLILILNYI